MIFKIVFTIIFLFLCSTSYAGMKFKLLERHWEGKDKGWIDCSVNIQEEFSPTSLQYVVHFTANFKDAEEIKYSITDYDLNEAMMIDCLENGRMRFYMPFSTDRDFIRFTLTPDESNKKRQKYFEFKFNKENKKCSGQFPEPISFFCG